MGKTLASVRLWQCWLWEPLVPLIGPHSTLIPVLQCDLFLFPLSLPTPTSSCYPHLMTDLFFPTPQKYPCLFTKCLCPAFIYFYSLVFRLTADKVCVIIPEKETAPLAKLLRVKAALRVASRESHYIIRFEKKTVTVMVRVAFVGTCQYKLATKTEQCS